jgi:ribosome-binding protein aMBF1 (putative translation factor)
LTFRSTSSPDGLVRPFGSLGSTTRRFCVPGSEIPLIKSRKAAPPRKKKPTNKPFAARFPSRASAAAKALGANVRRLRKQLELSQLELVEKLGTDQAVISLIELGRSNPRLLMIEAVAEALRTTAAALLSKPARQRAGT